jgi:hypothetical protein
MLVAVAGVQALRGRRETFCFSSTIFLKNLIPQEKSKQIIVLGYIFIDNVHEKDYF